MQCQNSSIHIEWVFSTQALYLETLLLKVVDYQRMLPWNLPYVSQVHIDLPNHSHWPLIRLFLIIQRTSPNYAIQLLHEKAPIASFEHGKTWIVKGCCLHLLRFSFEFYHKVLLSVCKVLHLVKIEIVHVLFVNNFLVFFSWWPKNILDSLNLGSWCVIRLCRENFKIFIPKTAINHHFFQQGIQLFIELHIFIVTIFEQNLVFQLINFGFHQRQILSSTHPEHHFLQKLVYFCGCRIPYLFSHICKAIVSRLL